MLSKDHRQRHALFDDKADKLLRSPLANAESVTVKLTWDREQPGVTDHQLTGVDETEIDAFVLTVRFFCQDRDGISLRRMADIYDDPSVPASVADRYRDCRAKFNAYLDRPTGMIANTKPLTHGDVLDVLLYGDLAHATGAKRVEFASWTAPFPEFAALVEFHFTGILAELANVVCYVRALNVELLAAQSTT